MCIICSSILSSFTFTNPEEHYDVFLSFGGDTRYKFTSHLRGALRRRRIKTYIDFNLLRGNEISSTLVSAIRRAKVSVIILSEHTAASKWCLDEIAETMDCKRTRNHTVVPIFYHVDPTDVRHQTGSYGVAFEEHMNNKENIEKVPRWREALTEAANLSGWHCSANVMEYELVENIAEDVRTKLKSNWLHINKTGEKFERQKDMLRELYKKKKITVEQTLVIWEMAKAANVTKDIEKSSKLSEEIQTIIEMLIASDIHP